MTLKETHTDEHIQQLADGHDDVNEAILLLFANKFKECHQMLEGKAQHSLIHAIGVLYRTIVVAVFTNEKSAVDEAKRAAERAYEGMKGHRRKTTATESLTSVFKRFDYSVYSDLEAHAELNHAEVNTINVFITFLSDQSFMSLIRVAGCLLAAYRAMRTCHDIRNSNKIWKSKKLEQQFNAGADMFYGVLNWILSHFPDKLLKLIGFFGLSADREKGLNALRAVTDNMTLGYRSIITGISVSFLSIYMEQLFGLGDVDLNWIKQIVDKNLELFPNGAFSLFFAGRYHQITGRTSHAIELFQQSVASQSQLQQLHNVANWDLIWCYALNREWLKAANLAKQLRDSCQWSPSTNAYQYACFLLMHKVENGLDNEMSEEINEVMASVEQLRGRYGGKTLPPEKFAITMAKRFLDGETTPLPALMLMYIWNIFGNSAEHPEVLLPFIKLVNKYLDMCVKGTDDYYVLMLLRGVCLRNSKEPKEALKCFKEITDNEDSIERDTFVPPHAALELGLTYLDLGDKNNSKKWLLKARDGYKQKFLIETMVHLRIHGALRKLKQIE